MSGWEVLKSSATLLLDRDLLGRVAVAEAAEPADEDVAGLGLANVGRQRRRDRRRARLRRIAAAASEAAADSEAARAGGRCRRATRWWCGLRAGDGDQHRRCEERGEALQPWVHLVPPMSWRFVTGRAGGLRSHRSVPPPSFPASPARASTAAGRRLVPRSSASGRRGRTSGRTRPGVPSAVEAMPSIRSAGVPGLRPSSRASRARSRTGSSDLAGPGDPGAVALGQQVVQGAVLEVGGEQARESARRAGGPARGAAARRRPGAAARGRASASRARARARPRRPHPRTRAGPRSAASPGRGRGSASPR